MRVVALVSLVACAVACGRARPADGSADAAVVRTNAASVEVDAAFVSAASELARPVVDAGGVRPLAPLTTAGQTLAVPAGSFPSGSTPGDEGRDPSTEPALVDVTMGAFAIDALPYPNDPAASPELASSSEEAARMCSERGARLCTELEWERACRGSESDPYPTGSSWNDACDQAPSRCASGFGVRAMGFMREWTDSRFGEGGMASVIRGGPGSARRCAARARSTAKGMPSRMAVRCCHGDRNDVATAPIEGKPAFRSSNIEASNLAKIFGEVPELSRIADGVRLFGEADVKNILARSGASADGIVFTTSPIVWSPTKGIELLVATGRAKKTGFIVALWVLPHDSYRFAASLLLLDDAAPIALAYEPSRRKELRWSSCWNCTGEQGGVIVRDDGRVVIVQY